MTTRVVKRPPRKARTRKPIPLMPGKAINAILEVVLDRVTKDPVVKIAIASFMEGRRLRGEWNLRITGAELVPAEPTAPVHEGIVTPD